MDLSQLPAAILAPIEALAQSLATWTADHPDAAFTDIETTVVTTLQTHAAALTAGVLQASQRGLRPGRHRRRPRCPDCGHRMRWHRWRPRTLLSRCGPVRWERPLARCHPCGRELAPTDANLGLRAGQRVSAGLTGVLTALGEAASFAEAAALLTTLTGVTVATETVRTHTETTGAALAAAADAAAAALAAADDPPAPPAVPPGQLVVEADGVMVRYLDGWHEAKVGLVGGWVMPPTARRTAPAARERTGRLVEASYVACRAEPAAFGARWGAEAARRGARRVVGWTGRGNHLAVLPKVVVLGDGAHWIWETAAELFGDRIEIIDYYHATEHVWAVARAVYGVDTPEARAWAEPACAALLAEGGSAVRVRLAALPAGLPAAATEVVRRERGYFTRNAARMTYPAYRAAGLPIGSGAIESSAKHLVQQRLKRPGQRWSAAGAAALLALRARRATALAQARADGGGDAAPSPASYLRVG